MGLTRRDADPQEGFTLIELLVAMTIFSIVMGMVFAGMMWIVNGEQRVSYASQASAQVEQAFQTLDSEVRYAADINLPGKDSQGNYWVEFESDWTAAEASTNSPQCTQLEYNSSAGTLQQREWLLNTSTTAPSTAGWLVLATNLSTSPSTNPFTLIRSAPNLVNSSASTTTSTSTTAPSTTTTTLLAEVPPTPWQLTLTLTSAFGKGAQAGQAQSSFAITALDITASSVYANVCGGNPS